MDRKERFFRAWYRDHRRYSLNREEWIYIGQLFLSSIIAFGLGLAIGIIWARFL